MMGLIGKTDTVQIANGEIYSSEIDMREYTFLAVKVPDSIDGTRLRLAMATEPGGDYADVQETDAAKAVTAGEWAVFTDAAAGSFAGWMCKLFFDDGSGNAETQGAAREMEIIKKRGA